MKKYTLRVVAIGFGIVLLNTLTPGVSLGGRGESQATTAAGAQEQVIRVQYWDLWQASGAELYQELCASCHGVDGAGEGPATDALTVPVPALTDLKRDGIPQDHWTYALASACEDGHHRARGGHETMPCWQRIFRQTLGNDAAPLLVNRKLVGYLASIQR